MALHGADKRAENAPSTRRRDETRRRLTAAAYEVFTEQGIAEAPIELICERAGFTRGAFYSNFASKEDLFLAVYSEQMRDRFSKVSAAFDDALAGKTVRDEAALRELIKTISTYYMDPLINDKNWYVLTVEFRAQTLRNPDLRAKANEVISHIHEDLGAMLAAMCERLGITLTVSPRHAAIVLFSLYEAALERAMFENVDVPLDSPLLAEVLPQLLSRSLFEM
jgi:AcrR family transcriptional regulator